MRLIIRYRNGALNGRGASLLEGYMEDLAADRIYRLMIAQRMKHHVGTGDNDGRPVRHTPELITRLFNEELEKLLAAPAVDVNGETPKLREARRIGEEMIRCGEFTPS